MVARATARASAGGQAERAEPVLPAERERDRVAELDELRLGEVRVQALPERGVGAPAVPRDRMGPVERRALASVEALRVPGMADDVVILGQVARTELLQGPVDDPA